MARISGPLLDRIDIHVEVAAVRYRDLAARRCGETSAVVRGRVVQARDVQMTRFARRHDLFKNADMNSRDIGTWCVVDSAGTEILKSAMQRLGLSARAYDRILKVSRTIADLAHSPTIEATHLAEAIQYRSLDRQFWNA